MTVPKTQSRYVLYRKTNVTKEAVGAAEDPDSVLRGALSFAQKTRSTVWVYDRRKDKYVAVVDPRFGILGTPMDNRPEEFGTA